MGKTEGISQLNDVVVSSLVVRLGEQDDVDFFYVRANVGPILMDVWASPQHFYEVSKGIYIHDCKDDGDYFVSKLKKIEVDCAKCFSITRLSLPSWIVGVLCVSNNLGFC